MKKTLAPLTLALVLLTTLPVGRLLPPAIGARDQGRSVACYPLAGALIGGLLCLVAWVTSGAAPPVAAAIVLAAWVALTGALHLDGLADAVDGLFAAHRDPARCLLVMADPAAGPMAVVALALVLIVKFAALAWLAATPGVGFGLLIVVPMLARAAVALFMATTPYRRPEGIATDQAATYSRAMIGLAAGLALIAAAVLLSTSWMLALGLAAGAVVGAWRQLWKDRIGGYTGDVAGALIELTEGVLLLVPALLLDGPGGSTWG